MLPRFATGRQVMSWISLTDEIRAIRFLLDREDISGPVNLTAPTRSPTPSSPPRSPPPSGRPDFPWLRVPAPVLRLALGEMSVELLTSARVLPKRLLEAGFEFRYPTLPEALAAELAPLARPSSHRNCLADTRAAKLPHTAHPRRTRHSRAPAGYSVMGIYRKREYTILRAALGLTAGVGETKGDRSGGWLVPGPFGRKGHSQPSGRSVFPGRLHDDVEIGVAERSGEVRTGPPVRGHRPGVKSLIRLFFTANTASDSMYGLPATKMCVVSARWPGAVTMKWMCAGRYGCRSVAFSSVADRAVGRDRVVARHDRAEPEGPVLIGGEQAAAVGPGLHVGLLHVVEALVVGLPDVEFGAGQRACRRPRATRPVTTHGVPVPTRSMVSPSSRRGDSTTWNGPSTVDSVAPPDFLLLIVSTSMEMPSTSESRMNSCRSSSHFWPVAVRKSIARSHSAMVGSVSLTNACRCLTRLVSSSRSRGSWVWREAVDDRVGGGLLGEVGGHGRHV